MSRAVAALYTAARCVAVAAWFAAALAFAWSMLGFGDVLSGAAALCCLLCALWGAWRLRLWRQLRVQNNPLLQRWLLSGLPAVLLSAALAVLLCAMELYRTLGESLPVFDGWLVY